MKLPPHHTFADPALGERALTHPSFSAQHNERLEWLGDAILEFEVSRLLYLRFPEMTEGDLSQIRAKLVTNATLAQVSRRLNLGDYARIGGADMQGGRENDNLLADLTEAYLAAIYLDGGDAQAHIGYWFGEEVEALVAQVKKHGIRSLRSPKTQLQEHLHKQHLPAPKYQLLRQEGKDSNPTFAIECSVDGNIRAEGRASTRVEAEQQAAAECLRQLTAVAKPAKKQAKKQAAPAGTPKKAKSTPSKKHPKQQLQEYLHQQKRPLPAYKLLSQKNKDKDSPALFVVECRVDKKIHAEGQGGTRRGAEGKAAAACLRQLTGAAPSP